MRNLLKKMREYLFTSFYSIISLTIAIIVFVVPVVRDLLISEKLDLKELILIFSTYILLCIFVKNLEKQLIHKTISKKHYPRSFKIVSKNILRAYHENSKSASDHAIEYNNSIDKIIKSPIDYANETLKGNKAPEFNPNDEYLDELFDDDISYIVAVTAENPNLWIDPTLCFYMTNCCAVSLINKLNEDIYKGQKIIMRDYNDDNTYELFVKSETDDILTLLKRQEKLKKFEFVRFLIFDNEQKDYLEHSVFPSLKASQDLFRIKSFFIQNDNFQKNLGAEYETYIGIINEIWDRIKINNVIIDDKAIKIINKRKEKHIPEFLILFKKNSEVVIHTYINGKAYKTPFINGKDDVNSDNSAIKLLVAYLAKCRLKNTKCDWTPTGDKLNKKRSYIAWDI